MRNEPASPKWFSRTSVGDPITCARQERPKNGAIGAAKIDREIELLTAQGFDGLPIPLPVRLCWISGYRPGSADARNEPDEFTAQGCGCHVQFCRRIVSFDFPQRWNQMNGVPEKAQSHHNYFAGVAGLVVDIGRPG